MIRFYVIFYFFCLFFGLSAIKRSIQSLPPGPYLQSCTGCIMVDGTLHCQCHQDSEEWNSQTLGKADECKYNIVNDHGFLKCLPDGPYLMSCARCWIKGDTLYCMACKNRQGQTVQILQRFVLPHISECRYQIVNNNAELNCLPDGPYLQYCSKCRIVDGVLQCQCSATPSQAWTLAPASIDLQKCKYPEDITYSAGQLECLE